MPQGKRQCHPLRPVGLALLHPGPVHGSHRRHRRQQVQGCEPVRFEVTEQPRPQFKFAYDYAGRLAPDISFRVASMGAVNYRRSVGASLVRKCRFGIGIFWGAFDAADKAHLPREVASDQMPIFVLKKSSPSAHKMTSVHRSEATNSIHCLSKTRRIEHSFLSSLIAP